MVSLVWLMTNRIINGGVSNHTVAILNQEINRVLIRIKEIFQIRKYLTRYIGIINSILICFKA